MVQALRSVQWATANKSGLATIFANPIYRGVKVFNRETRVEGEDGRVAKCSECHSTSHRQVIGG